MSLPSACGSLDPNARQDRRLARQNRAETEKDRADFEIGKLLPRERRQYDAEAGSGMPSRRNSVGVMPRRALKARLNGPIEL